MFGCDFLSYPKKSFHINPPQVRKKPCILIWGLETVVIQDLDVIITREQLLQRRKGAIQAPHADQQVRAAQRAPQSLGQRKDSLLLAVREAVMEGMRGSDPGRRIQGRGTELFLGAGSHFQPSV